MEQIASAQFLSKRKTLMFWWYYNTDCSFALNVFANSMVWAGIPTVAYYAVEIVRVGYRKLSQVFG